MVKKMLAFRYILKIKMMTPRDWLQSLRKRRAPGRLGGELEEYNWHSRERQVFRVKYWM
jgi:hypothetical protein